MVEYFKSSVKCQGGVLCVLISGLGGQDYLYVVLNDYALGSIL
jgi:phosphomevalonate kinase